MVNNDDVGDFSFGSECFILWDYSLSDSYFVIDFKFYLIVEDISAQWGRIWLGLVLGKESALVDYVTQIHFIGSIDIGQIVMWVLVG